MDNNVDNSSEMMYNVNNDESMIVVKLDEQRPLGDAACKHVQLIAEPDDTLGEAIYHGCANPKCDVGFYLRKK